MFQRLHQLINPAPGTGATSHSFEQRQLAAAALMVEAATMDGQIDGRERQRIRSLVRDRFELSADDAEALVAEAEKAAAASVQWHGFTQVIKDGFDEAERIALIEMLWEVAYADGKLHDYEASLLRRIAGLIYVSDRDSAAARRRARTRLRTG